jgi:hypothetical protein
MRLSLHLLHAGADELSAEADDFSVAAEERKGGAVLIASGDRDFFPACLGQHKDPLPGEGRRNGPHPARRGP